MDLEMTKNTARAKLVKTMREERAWPQRQLADVAGVNIRTVQRVERDGAASFDTLMAIAQAFDINVKELNPLSKHRPKEAMAPTVHFLRRLATGADVADVLGGADLFQISNDTADDPRAVNAMVSILDLFKQDVVRWHDATAAKRLKVELELSQELKGLESYGFYLFGIQRTVYRVEGKHKTEATMCTIYMSHSLSPRIVRDERSNMLIPALLPTVAQ